MVGRTRAARSLLRRVLFACLLLLVTGTLTALAHLHMRNEQRLADGGVAESPGLVAAYGEEVARPARFGERLTYTSLDAPGSGEAFVDATWDDAWFFADEAAYNHELAQMSSILAALAYSESGYYQAGSDQPAYMENALSSLGFCDVSTESYRYRSEVLDEVLNLMTSDADGVAYALGRKHLSSSASFGGGPRDLILVSVRGSYGSEWLSNVDFRREGDGDHGGYYRAAQEICREVNAWAATSMAQGSDVSVLFVGHSRGGAVVNLAAAQIDDCRLGYSADASQDGGEPQRLGALSQVKGVYAYTFASPGTTLSAHARDRAYANIFNIANPSDIMPYVPLKSWGYERYGMDKTLPVIGSADFEKLQAAMRKVYEQSVGVASAADPSDKYVVDAVLGDIASGIGSVEELATPRGALAVLASVSARVDPVRMLHSHYPSAYIAWMTAIGADDLMDS